MPQKVWVVKAFLKPCARIAGALPGGPCECLEVFA
jgi:hypothetical protein